MNLATVLDPHPDDDVALISRGRATTYGQLRDQVARLRGGLVGLGIEPGDRVGMAMANNWYFVVTYLAVLGAGAVAVPLNPASPGPELHKELAAIGARVAVVGPAGRTAFAGVRPDSLPHLEHVVSVVEGHVDGSHTLDELLASEPAPVVARQDGDPAALMFTSGTAGTPKAAMLTHGNLRSNIEQCQSFAGRVQRSDDVVLGVLPFSHIFGLNVVLGLSLHAGSTVVAIERFDPQSALEAIARHGVTIVSGAPTMWAAWASLPGLDGSEMATVRMAISGAAPLQRATRRAVAEQFGLDLTEGYGLTEASPVVTSGTGLEVPDGSIGVPLVGVHVRLIDPNGQDALVGDAGEVWVRGPNVFGGYWEDADATASALTDDGWLRTGDVAVVDDDGFLYLVDRVKDLIIVSGFNVFPGEVEAVLAEHPDVAQVAVVGVPHPHSGEAVKAFVVPRAGAAVEEDELVAHAEANLARYKCPQKVMFVDELPLNPAGKILRRELR